MGQRDASVAETAEVSSLKKDAARPHPQRGAAADNSHHTRFGIKAKLFLAFCSLAGLTAAASGVAWYVFTHIDRSVTHVTVESVPGMVTALSLAEKSAEIAATAPSIMASGTQEERVLEQARLEQRAQDLAALLDDLNASNVAPERTEALSDMARQITAELEELNVAVERRLRVKAQREAAITKLSGERARFLEALEPLVDDAVFDLVISGEEVTTESTDAITGLVEGGVSRIDLLLTINAEGNLAAGLLGEATHVTDPVLIQPIRERFLAASASVERSLRQLPEGSETTALQQAANALLALGTEADNVFEARERELRAAVGDGSSVTREQQQSTAALKTAHEALLITLTPMIDDAAFDLVLTTENVTAKSTEAITDLIDLGANVLHLLLTVRAEGNLVAGLLEEAAGTLDSSLLGPLNERFIAAQGQIERMLDQLPASVDGKDVAAAAAAAAAALIDLGRGDDGIFALRREELHQISLAQSSLEANRTLAVELGDDVAELVTTARDESDAAASRSAVAIQSGKIFMMIITVASLTGAAIVMLYYVGPQVIRPLESITEAMTDLAAGDTSVDIPGRERGDELGRMAHALGVFRDTAIEVQRSNLKEIRETRSRLMDAIESISEAFSLYDSDDRLVACNSKYRALLYPDIADEIVPGMTFEAMIRRAAEHGYIRDAQDGIDEWMKVRLAQHREPSGPLLQQWGDGQWVIVSERKTEDGGTVAVYSDITELKQREEELTVKTNALEQLSKQLAKYLSPQVYESIFTGRSEVRVASQRKKLTIFFADLEGFTEATDRLESEDLTQLLNHYLTEMSRIALSHGGTIDKYVGDAILIFFGDPETRGVKEDALACVRMAIAMRKRMRELEGIWRASGIENPPRCRTGINTGFCTVGNFGSEDRMDYTIIGGGVNLACRLEKLAPPGEILISYETYAHVKDEICCEERGHTDVKGISHSVAIYQVIDSYDSLGADRQLFHEDSGHLKLDLELDAMSAEERTRAATVLQRALERLSGGGKSARPAPPAKKERV
jgi:class 3 adenylate cyclase/phosphoglycerate-specific signal transduction histidine kinase